MKKILISLALFLLFALVNVEMITANQSEATEQRFKGKGRRNRRDFNFDQFKSEFGKNYTGKKEAEARENFERNKAKLVQTDCSPCGVSSLYDQSPEDLNKYLNLKIDKKDFVENQNVQFFENETDLINHRGKSKNNSRATSRLLTSSFDFYDWRTYNVVTPVKNQGSCGSCWIFSTTAFLESELILKKRANNTIDLAEEFLLKCDPNSLGCKDGSNPNKALTFVKRAGMPLESSYKYSALRDPRINYSNTPMCRSPNIFANFSYIVQKYYMNATVKASERTLSNQVLQRPIVVGVNALDLLSYSFPKGSSLQKKTLSCSQSRSNSTNHAVLLVGYTPTAWLIKNSWGTGWGDDGYAWITKNRTRNCGIGHMFMTIIE